MDESQLVAVLHKKGGQPDFVSVLGALGKHRAIHVYPGFLGFRWFREVARSSEEWRLRLMMAECEALQAAYPGPNEMTDLDMELMRGCRYPSVDRAFHFRSVRPGHFPWYVTEDEGRRLAACMEAFVQMLLSGILREPEEWWPEDRATMPMVLKHQGQWRVSRITVRLTEVGNPGLWIPEERLARFPFQKRGGTLCLGDHILKGAAGRENERPIVLQMVAAVDARSGYAFEPRLREPGEALLAAAAGTLANAIEQRGAIPERVLVPEAHYAEGLQALARAAGYELKVRKDLPALKELFRALDKFAERERRRGPELVH